MKSFKSLPSTLFFACAITLSLAACKGQPSQNNGMPETNAETPAAAPSTPPAPPAATQTAGACEALNIADNVPARAQAVQAADLAAEGSTRLYQLVGAKISVSVSLDGDKKAVAKIKSVISPETRAPLTTVDCTDLQGQEHVAIEAKAPDVLKQSNLGYSANRNFSANVNGLDGGLPPAPVENLPAEMNWGVGPAAAAVEQELAAGGGRGEQQIYKIGDDEFEVRKSVTRPNEARKDVVTVTIFRYKLKEGAAPVVAPEAGASDAEQQIDETQESEVESR